MAFTRRWLKGFGLTEEQVESVMEEHVAVTDALKTQITSLKEDTRELNDLQKELQELRSFKEDSEKADWETKYKDEHKAFEDFKGEVENQKTVDQIKGLYKSMLKEANIDDKRLDAILKVTDFSNMKIDKDGKLVDADKLSETIKKEWSGFVVTTKEKGQNVDTPPTKDTAKYGDNSVFIRERGRQKNIMTWGGKTEE